jgi:hypothetical protein
MKTIVPFDNSAFDVGGLHIESAEDKISVYGSLDLHSDQAGQAQARQLAEYFTAVATELTRRAQQGKLPVQAEGNLAPVRKANPLA